MEQSLSDEFLTQLVKGYLKIQKEELRSDSTIIWCLYGWTYRSDYEKKLWT